MTSSWDSARREYFAGHTVTVVRTRLGAVLFNKKIAAAGSICSHFTLYAHLHHVVFTKRCATSYGAFGLYRLSIRSDQHQEEAAFACRASHRRNRCGSVTAVIPTEFIRDILTDFGCSYRLWPAPTFIMLCVMRTKAQTRSWCTPRSQWRLRSIQRTLRRCQPTPKWSGL